MRASSPICAHCASAPAADRERRRLLDLLAVLEHPDALPPGPALRLATELLVLTTAARSLRCDAAEASDR
jgi:hypothetical protein